MIDTQREAATIWALDFDAELPCESMHSDDGCSICSVKAVGIKSRKCISTPFVICQKSYEWNARIIADNNGTCSNCRKSVAECWSIRPI